MQRIDLTCRKSESSSERNLWNKFKSVDPYKLNEVTKTCFLSHPPKPNETVKHFPDGHKSMSSCNL